VRELHEAVWDLIVSVTLKGVYLCSKYVLSYGSAEALHFEHLR